MATIEIERIQREVETEGERVLRWREEALLRVGYDARLALKLALRAYIDLHQAVSLVRRGCPPETAARILL
jgi:hypothetical protein